MNPSKRLLSDSVDAEVLQKSHLLQKQQSELQKTETEKMTPGQRLADLLAAQVGSWGFLISQTAILGGWVGMNVIPGMPHWDESPFMMLNLVFSFASAYTAPIVLMSQNRQSEVDHKKAEINHKVNLKAGNNIELLHEKMDNLQSQQLKELTQIVKDQQRVLNEMKVSVLPALNEMKVSVLPALNEIKVSVSPGLTAKINGKFSNEISANKYFSLDQPIMDINKFVEKHIR